IRLSALFGGSSAKESFLPVVVASLFTVSSGFFSTGFGTLFSGDFLSPMNSSSSLPMLSDAEDSTNLRSSSLTSKSRSTPIVSSASETFLLDGLLASGLLTRVRLGRWLRRRHFRDLELGVFQSRLLAFILRRCLSTVGVRRREFAGRIRCDSRQGRQLCHLLRDRGIHDILHMHNPHRL
ncbi:MAG: hypothetical protein ACK55Z_11500, partial [bacterium]